MPAPQQILAQLERARQNLAEAQRDVGRARNALVVAAAMAEAGGMAAVDVEAIRGAKARLEASAAGELVEQLEADVQALVVRGRAGGAA